MWAGTRRCSSGGVARCRARRPAWPGQRRPPDPQHQPLSERGRPGGRLRGGHAGRRHGPGGRAGVDRRGLRRRSVGQVTDGFDAARSPRPWPRWCGCCVASAEVRAPAGDHRGSRGGRGPGRRARPSATRWSTTASWSAWAWTAWPTWPATCRPWRCACDRRGRAPGRDDQLLATVHRVQRRYDQLGRPAGPGRVGSARGARHRLDDRGAAGEPVRPDAGNAWPGLGEAGARGHRRCRRGLSARNQLATTVGAAVSSSAGSWSRAWR